MNESPENIDLLINANTSRQLATVDWDQLHSQIQKRLDEAEKRKCGVSIKVPALRWAVGIISAAAILFVIFALMNNSDSPLPLPEGHRAAVTLTDSRTVVKTEIKTPNAVGHVSITTEPLTNQPQVCLVQPASQAAQCEVVITDQDGHTKKDLHPSWIIMMASKPQAAENQAQTDALDVACLLL